MLNAREQVIIEQLADHLNLDDFSNDSKDYLELACILDESRDECAQILKIGEDDIGELAHYAYCKASAMQCRIVGVISQAQGFERVCESIYNRLNATLQW